MANYFFFIDNLFVFNYNSAIFIILKFCRFKSINNANSDKKQPVVNQTVYVDFKIIFDYVMSFIKQKSVFYPSIPDLPIFFQQIPNNGIVGTFYDFC